MAEMTITEEAGMLVIRMPLDKNPPVSKSGKSLVVATTHGAVKSGILVQGKVVTVGVNAYITNK